MANKRQIENTDLVDCICGDPPLYLFMLFMIIPHDAGYLRNRAYTEVYTRHVILPSRHGIDSYEYFILKTQIFVY